MGDGGERKEREKEERGMEGEREREFHTDFFFFKNRCKMSTFMEDRIIFYFC